jgi:hypothetical protein
MDRMLTSGWTRVELSSNRFAGISEPGSVVVTMNLMSYDHFRTVFLMVSKFMPIWCSPKWLRFLFSFSRNIYWQSRLHSFRIDTKRDDTRPHKVKWKLEKALLRLIRDSCTGFPFVCAHLSKPQFDNCAINCPAPVQFPPNQMTFHRFLLRQLIVSPRRWIAP